MKQQILEREKLKLHRVLANNATGPLSPSSKSSGTPPGPLSPASPLHSPKQIHNAATSSLSPIAASVKDNTRSVTVQSSVKTVVYSAASKNVSPVVASKANSPSVASIPNLSIQIPNETANINLGFKKSTNSYIPVSNSQTRLVTAVNVVTVNTKDSDSQISVKDQFSLKNVQVQLKQGKTGRTVSLGDNSNSDAKNQNKNKEESEAQESPIAKTPNVNSDVLNENVVSTPTSDSNDTHIDSPRVDDKCDNSVDSAASTLIISRDEDNGENNTLPDSSTSTVIIPRNETVAVQNSEERTKGGTKKLKNDTETWEKVRGDVRKELDAIAALPPSEQKTYLANVEQNLVKKR